MPVGTDLGRGGEPGPVVRRLVSPKDDALLAARAAGLTVLEGRYSVHKYEGDVEDGRLYEVVECPPNLFLTAGVTRILQLITGVSAVHIDSTNGHLAVGNGTTTPVIGDTDLVGASKFRKPVSGSPTISGNQVTFAATFGTGDANFQWSEVAVAWAVSGANTLWSRSVVAGAGLGTKVSSASWVLNWTIAIS